MIDSGALDSLVTCLEEFDPAVKEAATWCLGHIAGHNTELAQQVVDAGEGGNTGDLGREYVRHMPAPAKHSWDRACC